MKYNILLKIFQGRIVSGFLSGSMWLDMWFLSGKIQILHLCYKCMYVVDMGKLTIYLKDEYEAKINEESKNRDISKSKLVREAIEEHYNVDQLEKKLDKKENQVKELKEEIKELQRNNNELKNENKALNERISTKEERINLLNSQLTLANSKNVDKLKNKANPLSRFFLAMALGFSGVEVEEAKVEDRK